MAQKFSELTVIILLTPQNLFGFAEEMGMRAVAASQYQGCVRRPTRHKAQFKNYYEIFRMSK